MNSAHVLMYPLTSIFFRRHRRRPVFFFFFSCQRDVSIFFSLRRFCAAIMKSCRHRPDLTPFTYASREVWNFRIIVCKLSLRQKSFTLPSSWSTKAYSRICVTERCDERKGEWAESGAATARLYERRFREKEDMARRQFQFDDGGGFPLFLCSELPRKQRKKHA